MIIFCDFQCVMSRIWWEYKLLCNILYYYSIMQVWVCQIIFVGSLHSDLIVFVVQLLYALWQTRSFSVYTFIKSRLKTWCPNISSSLFIMCSVFIVPDNLFVVESVIIWDTLEFMLWYDCLPWLYSLENTKNTCYIFAHNVW